MQDFDHQRTAHATDDGAIDFPCLDAGQAIAKAAVDTVGQTGTADMSYSRGQRAGNDIGSNGRWAVSALTNGDGDIRVVGPDIGNDGSLRNERHSRSQAVR